MPEVTAGLCQAARPGLLPGASWTSRGTQLWPLPLGRPASVTADEPGSPIEQASLSCRGSLGR